MATKEKCQFARKKIIARGKRLKLTKHKRVISDMYLFITLIITTLAGVVTYFAGYTFSPLNLELFTSAGHCSKLALGK